MPQPIANRLSPVCIFYLVLTAWTFSITPVTAQDDDASSIKTVADLNHLPSKIAFGSCSNQNKPQPVLDTVVTQNPDLFIYLGDNIYGDTKDMNVLSQKYKKLGSKK